MDYIFGKKEIILNMPTKKINFLCALPRTGATFLGSIINQSKQIQMTANSIVTELYATAAKFIICKKNTT